MKYAYLTAASLLLSATFCGSAFANELLEKTYIGVSGGASFANDGDAKILPAAGQPKFADVIHYDTGFAVSAFGGYRFNDMLRAQADLGFMSNSLDKLDLAGDSVAFADGSVSSVFGTVSLFLDYHMTERFTPFVGAGVGFLAPTLNDVPSGEDFFGDVSVGLKEDVVALFRVGGGASYAVTENVDLLASYDFMRSSDITVTSDGENLGETNLSTHLAQVGLRYNF